MVALARALCEDTSEWAAFVIAAAGDQEFPIRRGVEELARLGCLGLCPHEALDVLAASIHAQRRAFARGERVEAPAPQHLKAAIELAEAIKRLLSLKAAGPKATAQ